MPKATMTIIEAIKLVMRKSGRPLTAREAYNEIVARSLYSFQAKDPKHIVLMQIRRHCAGIEFPSASPTKHFQIIGDNTYIVIDSQKNTPEESKELIAVDAVRTEQVPVSVLAAEKNLWEAHKVYISLFKHNMLSELKKLSPREFEHFSRELMTAYGFEDVKVTSISRDGGIDGYGKLKVGLAYLNVSFQCKRWSKGKIQRPEIDKFRGASQGNYEQGIFFTTASFSDGAIAATIQRGAIPIVLLDGPAIVDLMINRKLRIESNSIEIPAFAL